MRIRKRPITAASKGNTDDVFNGAFSELGLKADDNGYEMNVSDEYEITLTKKPSRDSKYLPEIEVTTYKEDGKYGFSPKLKFPELDQDDLEFYDSIPHYLGLWEKIGDFIKDLVMFEFDPGIEYED